MHHVMVCMSVGEHVVIVRLVLRAFGSAPSGGSGSGGIIWSNTINKKSGLKLIHRSRESVVRRGRTGPADSFPERRLFPRHNAWWR